MALELADRWSEIAPTPGPVLIVGQDQRIIADRVSKGGQPIFCADAGFQLGNGHHVRCDEDRLPFADLSFQSIFAVGSLDSVDDIPGALILMRRCLRPGGLLLGAITGMGTADEIRSLTRAAVADGAVVQRFHPAIDVRAVGDLLARAGFSRIVADAELIEARYGEPSQLLRDARANGLTSVLAERHPLGRAELAAWREELSALSHPTLSVTFAPIYFTAYAPG